MAELERKRRRSQTNSPDKRDNGGSPEKQDNENCITCKELAKSDVIECQWCQKWEHKVCAKLSDDDFILLGNTSDRIRFYCSLCAPRVDVVLRFFDGFYEKQMCIDARLQDIETQLTRLSGLQQVAPSLSNSETMQVDQTVTDQGGTHPGVTNTAQPTSNELSNAVKSVINEEKERDRRKLNLIMHNIPESEAEAPVTRKQEDTKQVTDVFSKQLKVEANISSIVRLGKKGSGPKPRLLRVTVNSESEKAAILRNIKRLRLSDTPANYRKIFITPDLTPREREANKELRAQLAEANKEGNQFKIKNGRIVRRRD